MVAANSPADSVGAAQRDFLSPHEFVARSGLSSATVRRYLRDGRLPSIQPGGPRCRVLIPVTALQSFLTVKQVAGPNKTDRSPTVTKPAYSSNKPLPGPKAKWRQNK